jgi:hypothetical protein
VALVTIAAASTISTSASIDLLDAGITSLST